MSRLKLRAHVDALRAIALTLMLGASFACQRAQAPSEGRSDRETGEAESHLFMKNAMGTPFKLTIVDLPFPRAHQLARIAFREVERIERRVSSWRANSEIGALNRAKGDWSPLSAETHWLLSRAQDLNALTSGSFDVTWAGLKGLWDFRAQRLPSTELVRERLKLVGAQHLTLRGPMRAPLSLPPHPLWVRRLAPDHPLRSEYIEESTERLKVYEARLKLGSRVDLGGIAKGYALDSVARLLRRYGAERFLIDGGGDLLAHGRSPSGRAWTAGVRHPRREELLLTLSLPSGWSVVTSGDYERFFILGGERYHHIIDLRTGYPARGSSSVTLLAREATMADALATGMMVLGASEGLKVIEGLKGVEAMWMSTSGEITYSAGFHRFSQRLPKRWLTEPQRAEPIVDPPEENSKGRAP